MLLPLPQQWDRHAQMGLELPPPLVISSKQQPSEHGAGEGSCNSPDPLLDINRRTGSSPRSHCKESAKNLQPSKNSLPAPAPRSHCGDSSPKKPHPWRRLAPVARCVRLGCRGATILIAAGLAVLVVYWSLFPLCTGCEHAGRDSTTPETAAMSEDEASQPYSTLRINQLQVIPRNRCVHALPF